MKRSPMLAGLCAAVLTCGSPTQEPASPPPPPAQQQQQQQQQQQPQPQQPGPDEGAVARRRDALRRAVQGSGQDAPAPAASPVNQGGVPIPTALSGSIGLQSGPFQSLAISMDLMTAVGTSSEPDPVIQQLQGGHHDPRRRGFTLQQAELQITGAVDPFFQGRFVLVSALDAETNETIVEIEEGWLQTQQLPYGLQLRAGQYLTPFGRLNPVHPHAWDFQDQPVVMSRFFGEDGLRGPGALVSWLLPTETYLELSLGAQDAHGETMASFLSSDEAYAERPLGGRSFPSDGAPLVRSGGDLVWNGRVAVSFDPSPPTTFLAGVSGVFGPNATGAGAATAIYGADLMWRWRPLDNRRGYPFFKVQGEVMARDFEAAAQVDASDPNNPFAVAGETLHDWGAYLYAVWGFDVGWAFGLRGEYASGRGQSYVGQGQFDRAQDPWRADRVRVSPMLSYQTSEFSRLRLQYNFDRSDHLTRDAHSVWLGFEILVGPHQPHSY
ncbi:MAG: hypothetical protein H6835_18045 [Planctomycetes bacterium]|nr:hypothetical protein [Planctomycetota bacterium]